MNSRSPNTATAPTPKALGSVQTFSFQVGEQQCAVRATAISSISEVLGFAEEMEMTAAGLFKTDLDCVTKMDAELIVDLLNSQMISPLRPRRRRERSVSSRAMFYAQENG